jgi:hypothetical protein
MSTLDRIAELDVDAVDQMKLRLRALRRSLADTQVQVVKWNGIGDATARADMSFPAVIVDPQRWSSMVLPMPSELVYKVEQTRGEQVALAYQAAGHYRRAAEQLDAELRDLLDPCQHPVRRLVVLLAEDRIGYLKQSDEWIAAGGGPLTEEHQQAAHALLLAGLMPPDLADAYGPRAWGANDPEPFDVEHVYASDGRSFTRDHRGLWARPGSLANPLADAEIAAGGLSWEDLVEQVGTLTEDDRSGQ